MGGRKWTPEQDAELARLYPDTSNPEIARIMGETKERIMRRALKLGLRKSEAFHAQRVGCFEPGQTPWNKGKPHPTRGRSGETQFVPGHKPWTWRPLGSERPDKHGVLHRKVADTGDKPRDWRPVHVLIWEELFGTVPDDHIVIFRDGNNRNFDPANLECITRAENMRRNSYHRRYPKDVSLAIQAMGALNRVIRNRRQGHEKQN